MSNGKSAPNRVAQSFARGAAIGYAISPIATEFYLHRTLAHDTYQMHPRAKSAAWLANRMLGFNPTAWAVKHRIHHSPLDTQEPNSRVKGLVSAVITGLASDKKAQAITADEANRQHLVFPGSSGEDSLLKQTPNGIKIRYQNRVDEILARHPIAEKLVPVVAILGLSIYGRTKKNIPLIEGAVVAAAGFAGAVAGNFGPGLVGGAYPERRDGYTTSTEAGRDLGIVGQVVLGSNAWHASHHAAPHLSEPVNSMWNRDTAYDAALQVLNLGQPKDGVAA